MLLACMASFNERLIIIIAGFASREATARGRPPISGRISLFLPAGEQARGNMLGPNGLGALVSGQVAVALGRAAEKLNRKSWAFFGSLEAKLSPIRQAGG